VSKGIVQSLQRRVGCQGFQSIGRMEIMCKVELVDSSVNGYCEGDQDRVGKGGGRERR
jgi:hypothetical protein